MPYQKYPEKFQQLQQIQLEDNRQNLHLTLSQRHYGSCLIISRYSNGEPRFTLGPHAYIFLVALLGLTTLLIMFLIKMSQHLTTFWFIFMIICGIIFFFSYLNIGLSVPGFASKGQQPSEREKLHPKYCKPCKIVRTQNVYHCYDCDVCIDDYDHHCPWIGKCVGRNNIKDFYVFLLSVFGTLLMAFIAAMVSNVGIQNNLMTQNQKNIVVKN